jgi:hypothetical protein
LLEFIVAYAVLVVGAPSACAGTALETGVSIILPVEGGDQA